MSTGTPVINKPLTRPEVGYWVGVIVFVVACAAGGILLQRHLHAVPTWKPAAGIGLFAPLYIAAQALERLLEPLSHFYGATKTPTSQNGSSVPTASIHGSSVAGIGGFLTKSAVTKLRDAARKAGDQAAASWWQSALDQVRANATTLWAIASGLGMLLSGWIGFLLLHAIGVFQGGEYGWLDVLVTGLVIGGGTKPLHDLISNLQASALSKKDAPST